jgi:hypothetical protein
VSMVSGSDPKDGELSVCMRPDNEDMNLPSRAGSLVGYDVYMGAC